MKTIFAIFILSAGLAFGQQFGNVVSSNIVSVLPTPMNGSYFPSPDQYRAAGWRIATITNTVASTNLIATSYTPQDLDGTNCRLLVASSYDWVQGNIIAASNAAAELRAI